MIHSPNISSGTHSMQTIPAAMLVPAVVRRRPVTSQFKSTMHARSAGNSIAPERNVFTWTLPDNSAVLSVSA